jgi:hypothetical protein
LFMRQHMTSQVDRSHQLTSGFPSVKEGKLHCQHCIRTGKLRVNNRKGSWPTAAILATAADYQSTVASKFVTP